MFFIIKYWKALAGIALLIGVLSFTTLYIHNIKKESYNLGYNTAITEVKEASNKLLQEDLKVANDKASEALKQQQESLEKASLLSKQIEELRSSQSEYEKKLKYAQSKNNPDCDTLSPEYYELFKQTLEN